MNILILARNPGTYLNKKLEQLAKSSGDNVEIIDPLACELEINGEHPGILYKGKPIRRPDFVIPAMGPAILEFGLSVLQQFEVMGVPVLNSAACIRSLLNRYQYLQFLSSCDGIEVPRSCLLRKSDQIKGAIQRVKGPPVMMKVISSSNKLGAMLIDNASTAESYLDVNSLMGGVGQIGQHIIIEEFIKEANNRAINVLVLNDEVVASYYHLKAFNVKQSAKMITQKSEGFIDITRPMEEMAIAASRYLELDYGLISFLESFDGPKIFEVEYNPKVDIFDKHPDAQIPAKILAYARSFTRDNVISGVE